MDEKVVTTQTEVSAAKPMAEFIEDTKGHDGVDKDIAKYAAVEAIYIDEATNKRLKRLVDVRILPVMIVIYCAQALDKGTMSFASIMGIREDAHLVGQDYSWLTTCVYLTILVWEFPNNWIIQKVPVAKYLAFNTICWGIVLACHAAARSFAGFLILRILLGLFESCCQPIFILLSALWYKREEQAQIVSLWYCMNGVNQIIGGLLAYCFTLIKHAAMKNYEILFLVYGLVSVVIGFGVLWWMPDTPMSAKCWSEEDKRLLVERVRENQTGLQNKVFKSSQMFEAFKDVQCWAYAVVQFCCALPSGGLGAYSGILISSFGFSVLHTQLLAMVLGAYIIVILLGAAWLSKKFPNSNLRIMACFLIPSIIGTIVFIIVIYNDTVSTRAGLLFCYYITMTFWGCSTLGMSMLSRNVAGQTKKATATAMNFVGWAVGNAIGPQVFLSKDSPRYLRAWITHLCLYIICICVLLGLQVYLVLCNKKKDNKIAAGEVAEDVRLEHAFDDLTDKENMTFRYVY